MCTLRNMISKYIHLVTCMLIVEPIHTNTWRNSFKPTNT